jgi:hypothetical protein
MEAFADLDRLAHRGRNATVPGVALARLTDVVPAFDGVNMHAPEADITGSPLCNKSAQ